MMSNTRKWLPYVIYSMGAALFFIYYLFPSDAVKNIITSNFNTANPGVNITIDHITPSFPPGLKLHHVNLYYLNDALFKAERIKIAPNLLSLLRSRIIFFFKGSAFKGSLEGRGEFSKNRPHQNFMVQGKLSNVQMEEISAVKHYFGRSLTGMLNGDFTCRSGGKSGGSLGAKLVISDGEVELLTPVFNMKRIPFRKIDADLTMIDRRLKIKRCDMEGAPMNGSISGAVTLKEPPGDSYLKLSGVIKPNRSFLENLGKDFPANLLPEKVLNKGVIRIRIYGTLDEPRFFLN